MRYQRYFCHPLQLCRRTLKLASDTPCKQQSNEEGKMGLLKCRECRELVSTEARSCPNCGVKKPTKTKGQTPWWAIVLTVAVIGAVVQTGKRSSEVAPELSGTSSPECQVMKADGRPGDRECDLVELCKDRAFWIRKVRDSGELEEGYKATKNLEKTNAWIAEFRPEDVSAVCSGTYKRPQPPQTVAVKSATSDGTCSEPPIATLPVGQQIKSSELANTLDRVCPGASFNSDQTVTIKWEGKQYQVISSKLPFDGVEARYEITAIKAK